MCQSHSIHDYCLRDNLRRWFITYAMSAALNWLAHDVPDFETVWMAGASWGLLFMWSLEIGREWLKTRLPKGGVA